MSNPLGTSDLVGNLITCADLLNAKTKNFPAAVGTGLAATYVPLSVTFSTTAVSNVYQMPYAESLVLLVSLTSGTASSVSVNVGTAATNCVATANTGVITDTNVHAVFVQMPSAAVGTSQPGAPTSPFVSVSLNIPTGAQINQLALIPLGFRAQGADWFSVRGGGCNTFASGVVNSNDTLNPTNLIGSGAFNIGSGI